MPFIGPKPADTVLDSTLIADGSITSAKIADGAIVNADLNNSAAIATSKITGLAASATTDTTNAANIASGTIADARISASSVQQHATSFDDNKLVNDISTLAIRQASNENKGAYNTNSMYVDVFQDDTGIGTETNTARNDSEYISSITTSESAFSDDGSTDMLLHMDDTGLTDSAGNIGAPSLSGNTTRSSAQSKFGGYSAKFDGSGDELDYPDNAKFNYSTNDFTMEFAPYAPIWDGPSVRPSVAPGCCSKYVAVSFFFLKGPLLST